MDRLLQYQKQVEGLRRHNEFLTAKCEDLEKELQDAVTRFENQGREMRDLQHELVLKEQNIDSLEVELHDLNAFLAEKSEDNELLEEKLEKKIQEMEKEINCLRNKNLQLLDEIKSARKTEKSDTASEENQENIIREQLSTKDKSAQTERINY